MSRSLKFRLFDTKINKMVQYLNCSICITDGGVQSFDCDGVIEGTEYNKHLIPLQYIGRRDTNDKEIYEGDIVKVNDKLYEVIFDESFLGFNLKNYFDSFSDYPKIAFSELNNIEVIGNIYEDTELLKEVQ